MVADAKGVPGGVSGNKMKQVICCDEGSEDMRSEVRRGAELKVQKPGLLSKGNVMLNFILNLGAGV